MENDGVFFYQVIASHADIRNRNGRIYTSNELQNSAASLSERPLNINHDDRKMLPFPENQVLAARYEAGVVECIIQVADPKIQKQIDSGEINHVSIEGLYFDESKNTGDTEYPTSLHFRALALLTQDDEPGDPDARILRDHKEKTLFLKGEIREKVSFREQQTATFQTSGMENVCPICQALDGNQYPANNVPDDEQPPIHPNCSCELVVSSMDHALKIKKVKKMEEKVSEAEWTTAMQNDLPDSSFAYIEPGGEKDEAGKTVPRSLRHLPYKGADGKVDLPHLRNALARLSQTQLPAAAKAEARSKLVAAAKAAGINTSMDEALSLLTKANENYQIARQVAISILEDMDMDSQADKDPVANPTLKHPSAPDDMQDFDRRSAVQMDVSKLDPKGQQTSSPPIDRKIPTPSGQPAALNNLQNFSKATSPELDPSINNPAGQTTQYPAEGSAMKGPAGEMPQKNASFPKLDYPLDVNPLSITNEKDLASALKNSTPNGNATRIPLIAEKKLIKVSIRKN